MAIYTTYSDATGKGSQYVGYYMIVKISQGFGIEVVDSGAVVPTSPDINTAELETLKEAISKTLELADESDEISVRSDSRWSISVLERGNTSDSEFYSDVKERYPKLNLRYVKAHSLPGNVAVDQLAGLIREVSA